MVPVPLLPVSDRRVPDPPSDCEVCKDFGWVADRSLGPGRTELVPCPNPTCRVRREREQTRLDALFASAALPKNLRTATLEDFWGRPWVAEEVRAAEAAGEWLLVTGPYGTGKSHVAASVLLRRLGVGRTGLWVVVCDLLDVIRATYRRDATASEGELLSLVTNVGCLVLDDLGAEVDSDWVRTKLYQIVDRRCNEDRETICTSNLDPDALKAENRVGDRVISRVMGRSRWIVLDGEDRRQLPLSERGR